MDVVDDADADGGGGDDAVRVLLERSQQHSAKLGASVELSAATAGEPRLEPARREVRGDSWFTLGGGISKKQRKRPLADTC